MPVSAMIFVGSYLWVWVILIIIYILRFNFFYFYFLVDWFCRVGCENVVELDWWEENCVSDKSDGIYIDFV